jgi:hypothetical protein
MSSARDERLLIERLLGPSGRELDCDECFALLDRYVELELAEDHAEQRLPGMREHLRGCPACREDHDSLLAYVSPGDAG